MSGMVLTPVSPTPEKSLDRAAQASGRESGTEGFDEISAREQSRLDRRDARQDRVDKRAEDDRVADKRAEGKKADERKAEQKAQADEAAPADKADAAEDSDKVQETAESDSGKSADGQASGDGSSDDKQDGDNKGDESLPMLFSVPTPVNPDKSTAAVSTSAESGASPASAATANGLMLKASTGGGQNAGGDAGSDGLLQGKADTITTLLGKGATGDAKTADFSAQLARFQGGDSSTQSSSQTNPGQLQQRGLDSMATLKSYSTSVDLPVQHAEWGEKIAGKLAWLTSQRMSAAEIHVTPPDLGPLEVRVQVHHDQAQVTVHATHAAVRDQLELNGHRLRDMLQENGLNLDRFEVSADASGQGAQQQLQDDEAAGGSGQGLADGMDVEMLDDPVTGGSLDLSWRGEVDLYA